MTCRDNRQVRSKVFRVEKKAWENVYQHIHVNCYSDQSVNFSFSSLTCFGNLDLKLIIFIPVVTHNGIPYIKITKRWFCEHYFSWGYLQTTEIMILMPPTKILQPHLCYYLSHTPHFCLHSWQYQYFHW